MKIFLKILLALISIFAFLLSSFFVVMYFIGGFSYLYYDQSVRDQANLAVIIAVLLFLLLLTVIVIMFKSKKAAEVISSLLLILFLQFAYYAFIAGLVLNIIFGANGCSYTEDIANYGKYDKDFSADHFPDEITDDMTVVDFVYYYKYLNTWNTDIYLEVKFANEETMTEYLDRAKDSFSEKDVLEYTNPYDENYTDVIAWDKYSYSDEWYIDHNYVLFGGDEDYKYVNMNFDCISYSYEELTIIYTDTEMTDTIRIGNDYNKGYYYPKFLKRFEVQWDITNNFNSRDIFGDLDE